MVLGDEAPSGDVFTIGSGENVTVSQVAQQVAAAVGKDDIEPEITGSVPGGCAF
jgi:nucleoside-diphosphate-sugar epimerase